MSLQTLASFQAIAPMLAIQGFSPGQVLLLEATNASSGPGADSDIAPVSLRELLLRAGRPADRSEPVAQGDYSPVEARFLVWNGSDDPAIVATTAETLRADAVLTWTSQESWRTTSALFDLGFVRLGTADVAGRGVTGYLRSDRVLFPLRLSGSKRGTAAMSRLGSNGRFANQLFQYAFVRFYALRHELEVATPSWDGCELFGIADPEPDPTQLKPLRFFAFDDDDLALWTSAAPFIDVDFAGYFQELPGFWIHHRELLKRLFTPKRLVVSGLDDWVARITDGGRRPLAAIHVRRGDYPDLFAQGLGWYRPIPLEWYRAWLDRMKASVADLVVYVATDAPNEVVGAFGSMDPVTAADFTETDIAAHIVDFEVLRRADHLAIANSSFSRMSALLARDDQEVSIPDVKNEVFQPWDAWQERRFWDRFAPDKADSRGFGSSPTAVRQRSVALRQTLSEIEASNAALIGTAKWSADQIAQKDHAIGDQNKSINNLLAEMSAFKLWIDEKDAYIDHLLQQLATKNERIEQAKATDIERLRVLASTRAALTALLAAWKHAGEEHDRGREELHAVAVDRELVKAAYEDAMHAMHTAVFLGSPRGLARRFAFRPLIHVLSASSRIFGAVGLSRLSGKLGHDADMLRSRRYREWCSLLRRRLTRTTRSGHLRIGLHDPDIVDLPADPAEGLLSALDTSSAVRKQRRAKLRRIAEEKFDFTDSSLPNVVVVVPWLMQGGSEVVLLDVLHSVSTTLNISLITTLAAQHTNIGLFKPLVSEIHHLEGDLHQDEAIDFLIMLCRTRGARVVFSSNAGLIYQGAAQLKAADPGLIIIDLLHNDLREGHFASAVAAARSIDRQVVVGSHIAAALEECGLEASRISTIPNGVDTDLTFNPQLTTPRDGRRFHGFEEGGFVLGFVGRMSPEKRPSAFLDIVEALDDLRDLRILMVGSGPLDAEVEDRIAKLGRPVVWHRHLDRSDMAVVYATMDMLIVPSTIEGMPLAALEAMAMSVPVAATDVGNIRQIVDDGSNGFIVDVDRYMELAQHVSDLAGDHQRRTAMGQSARQAILAKGLTRSAMLDRYRRLFREATGTDN